MNSELTGRLPVVLLWHMHQPNYRDALSGEYVLPWTYLHALKDYSDMATHLENNSAARAVINVTPVLLEQIDEYSQMLHGHLRSGTPIRDAVLSLLTDAPLPTDPALRRDVLRACLRAQRVRMVERFEVYRALADRSAEVLAAGDNGDCDDALLHDLATWYHLAWCGEALRREHRGVQALIAKAHGFSPADRRELLQVIADTVSSVLPRWRALADSGRVEFSVSPYAHPILPLLQSFAAARDALPDLPLPQCAAYPGGDDRARWHVAEGLRIFQEHFGRRAQGCWPSEGAVSALTLATLEQFGFTWVASSANVLRHSLPPEARTEAQFNCARALAGQNLQCYFRNDSLSDLIGFEYANWHGDDAARHFANELAALATHYLTPGRLAAGHALLIALDGENAWEHYPDNGWWFLQALYRELAQQPQLELTTLAELTARAPQAQPLQRLVAGSWVHGTLATWMGDPAKNAAWELLCRAKHEFDRVVVEGNLDEAAVARAERQLALCESSDWFWWFGDYNPADAVSSFDRLYRRQLTNLYTLLRLEAPPELNRALSGGGGHAEGGGTMRRGADPN